MLTEEKKEENLLLRMVKPHSKVSREVVEDDIERVTKEANVLYNLCFIPDGLSNGAKAMAHSQICDNDPLRFFVTANKDLIINPKIIKHTNTTVDSLEGCRNMADKPPIVVQRYHKIEVEFQTLIVDPDNKDKFKFSSVLKESLSGKDAKVFQHEIDHCEGRYIFNY